MIKHLQQEVLRLLAVPSLPDEVNEVWDQALQDWILNV